MIIKYLQQIYFLRLRFPARKFKEIAARGVIMILEYSLCFNGTFIVIVLKKKKSNEREKNNGSVTLFSSIFLKIEVKKWVAFPDPKSRASQRL